MARRKRHPVNIPSIEIKERIEKNKRIIEELTDKIKKLKNTNRNLEKDLIVVAKAEQSAAEQEALKELVAMMKEQNISLDDVRNILNGHQKSTEE